MASPPSNQSCASCYVWLDGPVKPRVAGFCTRSFPRALTGAGSPYSQLTSFPFAITQSTYWCLDGLDAATLVPYSQPQSGGSSSTVGTFTCSVGVVTIVVEPKVTDNSVVQIMPTNASALTLSSTASFSFLRNAGVGFNLSFTSGGPAAGTETFSYQVIG